MIKISIITITLNSEKTISQTIESVLSQGYSNLEYLIIDGVSTDSTLDIVRRYNNGSIKLISEKDHGISDAFNKGISMATGELIGIINSDDLLAENSLALINEFLKPETDVLYGNAVFFDDKSRRVCKPGRLDDLKKRMSLLHPATFIRKRAYEKYGVFDCNCKYSMDRELLLRMFKNGAKFQYLDEVLASYRFGGISDTKYIKGTVPETARISKQYGRNSVLVFSDTVIKITRYKISRFLKSSVAGRFILDIYHLFR